MYPTVQGIIRRGQIELPEKLALPENATVLITVLADDRMSTPRDWLAELEALHTRLRASGHRPPTPDEVTARIAAERAAWKD